MVGKGERGVWQRRFWEHAIRDERDFSLHCDYIHYNPVRHGLVKSPREWKHSTFDRFVRTGVYPLGEHGLDGSGGDGSGVELWWVSFHCTHPTLSGTVSTDGKRLWARTAKPPTP
jgi:hypothetical protein